MSSDLMRYSTGEVMPHRAERGIAKQAKRIYDAARLAGFEADAQAALAGHVMQKVVDIDTARVELAGDNPVLNALLSDVEIHAVRNMKRTMSNAFGGWNL